MQGKLGFWRTVRLSWPCSFARLAVAKCIYTALQAAAVPTKVTLKRFYRPEDISRDHAYKAEFLDVFASTETQTVPVEALVSHCRVVSQGKPAPGTAFQCIRSQCI